MRINFKFKFSSSSLFEPLKEVLSEDCNLSNVGTRQYSPITLFLYGKLNDRYVSDAEVTKP